MPSSCSGPRVTEQLTIARLGHRGDGIADTPAGPVYVPYALAGRDGDGRAGRRPSRPPPPRSMSTSRATSAATPICKHFGQCGGCAMQHWSLAEYHLMEARAGGRGAGAGRPDRAGRAADRRARARPPARGAACAARRPRHAGSRLHGAARASHRRHRPLPDSGPGLDGAIPAAWAIAEISSPPTSRSTSR